MLCLKRREVSKVQIGNAEYSEIIVTDKDGGVLAVVSDSEVIEESGCKVVCVPVEH